MFFDSENYELTLPDEVDSFLAELPFDLLKANIEEQVNDPMSTRINYVDIIIEKCELYKKTFAENEEALAFIQNALEEFFTFVVSKIEDRFDLGIDVNELASTSNIVEIGEALYNYFIIRYVKNISKFVTTYIVEHKKDLSAYYADKNKKDITSLSFKKQIKDPHDLAIIVNLSSIVNYIISLDMEPLEFVSLSAGQHNYDAGIVKNMILSNKMVGNFVRKYIDLSIDEHDYLIDTIQTDIRVRIIKKIT